MRSTVGHNVIPVDEIRRYLSAFEVEEEIRLEVQGYLQMALYRFQRTMAMLPPGLAGSRLLELGAAPYLISLLLRRHTPYKVFVANYFGGRQAARGSTRRYSPVLDQEHTFDYDKFNVEEDPFPYPDGFLDVVLCCELLEHLTFDPTLMLVEIHRVLKDGGKLLLTTPNVLVLRHMNMLARKRQNIYGRYSAYGVYGRHNREWTLDEVVQIVNGCGYTVEVAEIHDTYPHRGYSRLLKKLFPHLRDVIFVLARAEGEPHRYYPENLYMSRAAR